MRELLFRAHITDTWELIYSRTVQDKYKFTMYFAEWLVIEKPSTHPRGWEYVDATMQQFTGLYDKNDKPIYEWDIVQIQFGNLDQIVDEYAKIWSLIISMSLWDDYMYKFANTSKKYLEIIWNIYQNPELLNTSTS